MDQVLAIFYHQRTKGQTNNWPVGGWLISSIPADDPATVVGRRIPSNDWIVIFRSIDPIP